MNFLVIDTSSDCLVLALKRGEVLFGYKSAENRKGHSTLLLPEVEKLLKRAELTLNDIDYFGAVVGPGSFTGVRVGVATVNAFGYVTKKDIIPVTSFEPFAYNKSEGSILAIDAKHAYYLAEVKNGVLHYTTNEEHTLPDSAELIDVTLLTPEMLAEVMQSKIDKKAGQRTIEPFYMRASEAERNLKK